MIADALLAFDWGTTAARAYRLDASGAIVDQRAGPYGVQQVRPGEFPGALAALLGDWRQLRVPRLACGMIGSRQGWREAPYAPCPAPLSTLARNAVRTDDGALTIVGGVTCRDSNGVPDVMRGEETQVAGLPPAALRGGIVVHPGTHSKWTVVRDDAIVAFTTYMTGETFAVLREHSILGRLATASAFDAAAFDDGVHRGAASGHALLHDIFGARTLALMGELAGSGVADYLSGVLIGSEVAAGRAWTERQHRAFDAVWVVGMHGLCERYERALHSVGLSPQRGPDDAAARGLWRLACEAGVIGQGTT